MSKRRARIITCIVFAVVILLSYYLSGLFIHADLSFENLQIYMLDILAHPGRNYWNDKTPLVMIAGIAIAFFVSSTVIGQSGTFMHGREYGNTRWANIRQMNRRYAEKSDNHILSERARLSYDPKRTNLNNNQLIIGGSGKGKGFRSIIPNLHTCHGAYIVTDAKGDTLRAMGDYMERNGYTLRILNLLDFECSLHYNPFHYLVHEEDVDILVDNIMANTKLHDTMSGDQFWEDGPRMLTIALINYVWLACKKSEQNWTSFFKYFNMVTATPETNRFEQHIDKLELEHPMRENHPAVKAYKIFKDGAQETMASVLMVLKARLQVFSKENVKWLLQYDELDLYSVGLGVHGNPGRRVALFVLIPDEHILYSAIVGMLYTQLFQILFAQARSRGGSLPFDVGFYLDEYPNIKMPKDFIREISTVRSRRIYAKIYVQSISQLKSLHKDDWQTIAANCDTLVYLGTGEKDSYEYISDLMGEFTINKKSNSQNYGNNTGSSTSVDILSRKLMIPAEVRLLKNEECIILIHGLYPIRDKKYRTEAKTWWKQNKDQNYRPKQRGIRDHLQMRDQVRMRMEEITDKEAAYYRKQEQQGYRIPYITLDEDNIEHIFFDTGTVKNTGYLKQVMKKANIEEPDTVEHADEQTKGRVLDLTQGTVFDWMKQYPLNLEQTTVILKALEDKMTDDQIRTFYLPDESARRMDEIRNITKLRLSTLQGTTAQNRQEGE